MDEFIGRKYKLKSSENFEEYMKSLGIGLISRKAATSVNPEAELIRNEDGSYTFTLTTFLRVIVNTFKLNEEFVEERADGEKVNTVITMEGNKLIQTQVDKNGRKSVHVREFTPELLTVTSTIDGWDGKCIRIYELIEQV